MKAMIRICAVSIFASVLGTMSAAAGETGIANIHAWVQVGKKICIKDHWHYGNSMGLGSKRAAEIAAIKSWEGFVAFEYGDDWANFAKASSKSMKCTAPYKGTWSCDLNARPCR